MGKEMRVQTILLICAVVCFNLAEGSKQNREDEEEREVLIRDLETPGDPLYEMQAPGDPASPTGEAKEELTLMDLNGDGKASLAEIQVFFKKEFYGETELEQTKRQDG